MVVISFNNDINRGVILEVVSGSRNDSGPYDNSSKGFGSDGS